MRIHYFNPYALDGNIGAEYNYYCSLVKSDNDWICFTDGDMMWLEEKYGHHLTDIIDKYPDTGLFSCITNRVGSLDQCYRRQISSDFNVRLHKQIAVELQKRDYFGFRSYTNVISGHMMLFRKSTWKKVKFPEGKGQILGVDNLFSKAILQAGFDIKILTGVYVFHQYRILQGINDKRHLQ